MNRLDAILLLALGLFALRGYWRGFLRESFGLLGLVGGALAAAAGSAPLAAELEARQLLPSLLALPVAGVALFLLVYLSALLSGILAERIAHAILLGGLNRVAGVAFGVAKGAALLGFALIFVQRLRPPPGLTQLIADSRLGAPLSAFATGVIHAGQLLVRQPPPAESV